MAVLDAKGLIVFKFSAFEYYFIGFIVEPVFFSSGLIRSAFISVYTNLTSRNFIRILQHQRQKNNHHGPYKTNQRFLQEIL